MAFSDPIYVIGYPGECGGANTECWHTVKVWRRHGIPVKLIPTWDVDPIYKEKLDALGCETIEADVNDLPDVPGLRGAVCVSFCNENFLKTVNRWRELDCRVVWVNCMTVVRNWERVVCTGVGPFSAYVFQSNYQRREIEPTLAEWGYAPAMGHLIRGAFDVDDFPYRPRLHAPGEPFFVGRVSRAAPDKFNRDTWSIARQINYRPLRARVMGWNREVEAKVGVPPSFAQTLPERAETTQEFLSSLHCLLHVTGGSRENWPRIGLEAMAAGVPIVAERNYGWPEMVVDGKTGHLGEGFHEWAHWPARMAWDEEYRLRLAGNARARVEALSCPEVIGRQWIKLFESVSTKRRIAA